MGTSESVDLRQMWQTRGQTWYSQMEGMWCEIQIAAYCSKVYRHDWKLQCPISSVLCSYLRYPFVGKDYCNHILPDCLQNRLSLPVPPVQIERGKIHFRVEYELVAYVCLPSKVNFKLNGRTYGYPKENRGHNCVHYPYYHRAGYAINMAIQCNRYRKPGQSP